MADTTELFALDYDIWQALSGARISQARVDQIAAAVKRLRGLQELRRRDASRMSQENRDLRTHLKDRDRYIKLLEEQLMPYLRDEGDPPVQEVMLEA